jgi:hypothetical protein
MNGIKISYGNQTKRISETIANYENLLKVVKKLFSVDQSSLINDNSNHIHLYYIDKDQEKIEVASQEDFIEVIKYHQQSRENAVMKLELVINYLKDSNFIDQMLDDVKMSESFAMIDKRDINNNGSNTNDKFLLRDTKLGDVEFDLQASAVSGEVNKSIKEDIKEEPIEISNQEKGVQIETFCVVESKSTETEKVQTAEVAENTPKLEKIDGFSQCEVDDDFEICAEKKEDQKIKLSDAEKVREDKLDQDMNININDSNINVTDSQMDDLLVSKIDHLIASRLSLLESNFKKMLEENHMHSKSIYQNQLQNEYIKVIIQNQNEDFAKLSDIDKKTNTKNLEFSNLENINIINQEQKKIPRIEIDEVKSEFEIKSQGKPEPQIMIEKEKSEIFSSLSNSPKNNLKNSNQIFHFNEYCSVCKYQILKNKYVCLICENFSLCSHCESNHLDHPLMKVNVNNKAITTKEELEKYFKQQRRVNKNIQKKGGFFNKIGKMFKHPDYDLHIQPKSSTIFAMPKDSILTYTFQLENRSNKKITEEIVIYPKNNKNFQVTPVILNSMDNNEHKEIELTLTSPKELGSYEFEITAKINDKKLILNPFKLQVIVTNPDDIDEANANLMFGQFEEIMQLPKEKRITLYNLINGQVVKKDFKDVLTIMRKHDFEIDEALNDLMDEDVVYGEKNRNYNFTDIQYY